MTTINPCPMCGSPAILDSTGASESYGYAWQTVYIDCTDANDQKCDMSLNLTADFSYVVYAEDALIECWNKLTRRK